jgi:hypothetical protein
MWQAPVHGNEAAASAIVPSNPKLAIFRNSASGSSKIR